MEIKMTKPNMSAEDLLSALANVDASKVDMRIAYPEPALSTKMIQASSAISILTGQPPSFAFNTMVWFLSERSNHKVVLSWGEKTQPMTLEFWGTGLAEDTIMHMSLRGVAAELGLSFDPCPEE
jgi:hypothetical protein